MSVYDKAVKVYTKFVNKPLPQKIGKKFDKYWAHMSGEESEKARQVLNKTIANINKDKRLTSAAKKLPKYKHERYREAYKKVLKADLKRTGYIAGTAVGAVGTIRATKEILS